MNNVPVIIRERKLQLKHKGRIFLETTFGEVQDDRRPSTRRGCRAVAGCCQRYILTTGNLQEVPQHAVDSRKRRP